MLHYYRILRKHFAAEMLAEHDARPLISYACIQHEGVTIPYTHFALTRDHISNSHKHSHLPLLRDGRWEAPWVPLLLCLLFACVLLCTSGVVRQRCLPRPLT
jgi:hypothetical protein